MFKIYGVKALNEDGRGNGIGDYICSVYNYEDIGRAMRSLDMDMCFVTDESGYYNTFYIEDFENMKE